jgi:hypothetical protein
MAYTVLSESDLLSHAPDDASGAAERLATSLTAVEEQGLTLVTVDRPQESEALYVFSGHAPERRLSNIR